MSSDQDSLNGSGNCFSSNDNKSHENYFNVSASAQPSTPYTPHAHVNPYAAMQSPQSNIPASDCMFSPIPQFDGNSTLPDIPHPDYPPVVPNHDIPTLASNSRPLISNYMATYSLDRPKQLRKLRHDTTVPDYTIEVSPSNENVNIYCNTGFYAVVAKPTLESLAIGTMTQVGDIGIKCHDITNRTDATQAITVTVVMYRLYLLTESIGQVTIHLHHTARKVQVQGRALLPDKTKAPIWFVEKVLKPQFENLCQSKAQEIIGFNSSVGSLVNKHLNQPKPSDPCGGCTAHFNGRSSPALCDGCNQYFHKKCMNSQNHLCYANKRMPGQPGPGLSAKQGNTKSRLKSLIDNPTVIPTTSATSVRSPIPALKSTVSVSTTSSPVRVASAPTNGIPDTTRISTAMAPGSAIMTTTVDNAGLLVTTTSPGPDNQQSVTHRDISNTGALETAKSGTSVTATSSPISGRQPSPAPGTSGQSASATGGHLVLCTNTQPTPESNLNPCALPFESSINNRGPNSATTKNGGKGKKGKGAPAQDLSLEYAQYQVNVTQAKIREQEITIKDLKFKNEILEARVAELEKKQKDDIYNKYFNSKGSSSAENSDPQHRPDSCHHSTTHLVLPCCNQRQRCCTPPVPEPLLTEQTRRLCQLESDIAALKNQVDLLSESPIVQLGRTEQTNTGHSSTIRTPATPLPTKATPPPYQTSQQLAPALTTPVPGPSQAPASCHGCHDHQDMINISQMTIDDAIHDASYDLN